ncbi:hypothetical protein NJB93_14635 [Brucella intermedia]|uniref:hypothetical protein n=1 Tax=Brucella intermedia TaxID=94625 RepID=UPI00209B69CD|nr:hypothetical protein [Brucella intermedia]MCO7727825.1 hypothetical protein [Brucella intermedia]
MPSKELIEEIAFIIRHDKDGSPEDTARDILEAILTALQEPTEAALEAGYAWDEHVTATETHPRNRGLWRAMLAASTLGEQSE